MPNRVCYDYVDSTEEEGTRTNDHPDQREARTTRAESTSCFLDGSVRFIKNSG